MKICILLVVLGTSLIFSSCRKDPSAIELQLDFKWSKPNECSETSPEIRIGGLPETAESLRVRLIDAYQPGADHGGWEQIPVPAGNVIAAGGLKQYRGPCPPKYYATSQYEFTVEALDRNGALVAEGKLARGCCPSWE